MSRKSRNARAVTVDAAPFDLDLTVTPTAIEAALEAAIEAAPVDAVDTAAPVDAVDAAPVDAVDAVDAAPVDAFTAAVEAAVAAALAARGVRWPVGKAVGMMPPVKVTKKGIVLELACREFGVTIAQAADHLGIGETAVRSLIGDLRRDFGSGCIVYNSMTRTYHAA